MSTVNQDQMARAQAAFRKSQERSSRSGFRRRLSKKETQLVIRAFPAVPGKTDNWFYEIGTHYFAGRSYDCPKSVAVSGCPLCDLSEALMATEGDKDKEEGRRMKCKFRYLMWVVVRGQTEPKAEIFEGMPAVFEGMCKDFMDPAYGDITDPYEGFDYLVSRSGAGLDTTYDARVRPNKVPLASSDDKIVELLNSVKPFSECLQLKTEEELRQLIDSGGATGGGAPEEPPPAPVATPAVKASVRKSIQEILAGRKK